MDPENSCQLAGVDDNACRDQPSEPRELEEGSIQPQSPTGPNLAALRSTLQPQSNDSVGAGLKAARRIERLVAVRPPNRDAGVVQILNCILN